MKKTLTAIIATTVLVGCSTSEENITPTALQQAPPVTEADPLEPEPYVQPELDHAKDTGSYDDFEHYMFEMEDSTDKVASLLEISAGATEDYLMGLLTDNQLSSILEEAANALEGHIHFFEARTAPEGFREAESMLLQSWQDWEDSFFFASECAAGDYDSCAHAEFYSEQANDKMQRATNKWITLLDEYEASL